MASPLLLDTCATLWQMNGEKMTSASRSAIRATCAARLGIHVSPFTAWEIGTLVAKDRLFLTVAPETWFENLLALPGVRLAALTPAILLTSTRLPGLPPSDPADRILAATARAEGFRLVTRDHKLLAYARQGHLQVIPC